MNPQCLCRLHYGLLQMLVVVASDGYVIGYNDNLAFFYNFSTDFLGIVPLEMTIAHEPFVATAAAAATASAGKLFRLNILA